MSAHSVEIVDVEWLTDRVGWTLRVTIERPGAGPAAPGFGVTLEDCVEVSRDVSALLDADADADEELIPQQYHLEVSSPGLDRPLRSVADFTRFVGQTAKVKLKRPAPDGQKLLRGHLAAPKAGGGTEGEERIAVLVDGKHLEVPYSDVSEAHLVYELAAQPKQKPAPRGKKSKDEQRASASSSKRQ
ncbi:MAG: ribosome maturation factor RimP [Minicystis sp.]